MTDKNATASIHVLNLWIELSNLLFKAVAFQLRKITASFVFITQ